MTNRARSVAAVKTVAGPLVHKGLLRLITSMQPDVIVSIHPMLNHITVEAIQELGLKIPFVTVVTDLISVHHSWYAPGADSYVVPTEAARQLYLRRGLDPEKIHVLGMPIDPKYTLPQPSKEELRRKLHMDLDLPAVLLTGGGDGAGGLRAAIHAVSQARLPVQLLVVTGRNKRLFVQLQRERTHFKVPVKILGFVNNMPELMHASNVIITKAGPGTICEALACGLPIILSGFVPGQEEGNVTFVTENNAGVLAEDPAEMVEALRRLLASGSQLWQQQLENARRISRPRASFDIASHILSLLCSCDEPGVWQNVSLPELARLSNRRLTGVTLPAIRPKLPAGVAASSSRRRHGDVRSLNGLGQTTRTTGSLDARAISRVHSRRLPRLIGRTRSHDKRGS
jgi:1,2-diacylglycerol 3-beta-galactosyltransferase